jgi:outer membrane protein assembly factor BamA
MCDSLADGCNMRKVKKYWILANLICFHTFIQAQDVLPESSISSSLLSSPSANNASVFIVGKIYIEGNKRTKPYIIERELPFKPGDSLMLPALVQGFEISRQQLMNTTLFNEVVVALKSFRGYFVDIIISVKERWYIFPIPYLKPVDRNLTEWATQGLGFDRLNYGFKFTYYNFTGRNDRLKLWLITGYTKQIQFQYEQPYADKTLKHGYKIGVSYSFNKEINYQTISNQQHFIDTLSGTKRWNAHIEYTYRPKLRTVHGLRLAFVHQQVDSQVLALNPKYFNPIRNNTIRNQIAFPEISYTLNYTKVDYIPYPLTGWSGEVSLLKRGINSEANMWQLGGKLTRSWKLANKIYFGWQGFGMIRVPFDQPFINQRMLGYSDLYVRGLEKYVIDGVAATLSRQTLRYELLNFTVPTFLKSRSHDQVPFRIYPKVFFDYGYVYNKYFTNNSLVNRPLYSAGFGIDVVSFYDFILRLDYSFNQLGQNGLFLHLKNDF